MKRHSMFTSVKWLIVAVVAVLAFTRGEATQWLAAGVFAVWLLVTGSVALYRRWPHIRLKAAQQRARWAQRQTQAEAEAAQASAQPATAAEPPAPALELVEETDPVKVALLQVNCRITDKLHSVFPDAVWCWESPDPQSLALRGGEGRLKVSNAGEFGYVDVIIDQLGSLKFKLLKIRTLEQAAEGEGSDGGEEEVQPPEPRDRRCDVSAWFDLVGSPQITELVTDLNSRGHRQLFIQENGDVFVVENEGPSKQGVLPDLPEAKFWDSLAELFTASGIKATVEQDRLRLAWAE